MAGDNKDLYFMDSSSELERLRVMHRLYTNAAGNKIIFAPIDWAADSRTVLDSGGADGTLMLDLSQNGLPTNAQQPNFIVTDLIKDYFPKEHPANFEFVVQDIKNPWPAEWASKFDLIHQRLVFAASTDKGGELVRSFYDLIKPGGWIQLGELYLENPTEGDHGPATRDFFALLRAVFTHMGQDPDYARNSLRRWVEDAGFIDVQQTMTEVGTGNAQPNPELRAPSVQASAHGLIGLVGLAKSLDPMPPSLQEIDLDTLKDRWMAEAYEKGVTWKMIYIWGRRLS